MNKTKIEWADDTWNPVTGCLHGCPYCYAQGIAHRFRNTANDGWKKHSPDCRHDLAVPDVSPYPYDFVPTLHRYRLGEPARKTRPRTIFVCSMADLFGEWVPDEWIQEVFAACEAAPRHTYLFLTKNPKRYLDLYEKKAFPYTDNFWFGTTCTTPDDEFTWMKDVPYHCFVSIEPLMSGGWDNPGPEKWPDWVIIGAETGRRKGKVVPKAEWVADIVATCTRADVPVFMKDSLVPVVGEENMLRQWPWTERRKA